jgi:hypothetical protein
VSRLDVNRSRDPKGAEAAWERWSKASSPVAVALLTPNSEIHVTEAALRALWPGL